MHVSSSFIAVLHPCREVGGDYNKVLLHVKEMAQKLHYF